MNERVKELAEQARLIPVGQPDGTSPYMDVLNHFAELIVRECIRAVDLTNTHHVHTSFDDNLVRTTMSKTKTAIKQHFGVEE